MHRCAHATGCDQDQQFVISEGIAPHTKQISHHGKVCKAGEAGDAFRLFAVEQAGNERGFVFFQADRLSDGAIGDNWNSFLAGPRESLDFKLKLKGDFVVVV